MSETTATRPAARARPLSPHLTVYRWPITMTMSILHRITGGALYVGTLLIAWWLIAAATSPAHFAFVQWLITSWLGLLVLFGYTFALFLHLLGGIRHFIWDVGAGLDKHTASKLGWATLIGAAILTVAVWVVYFLI
ncbi:MAG: succinate dehydrogenase, cytochrome b556 subunit [Rhizobiales bacterium]|nr:succinate dehydrogenase, cytochrome b556 subunit [Hyphomicrobiales bacterium]MBN9262634.1 succinate dehydrogenase, cytochrome b556 subunit [Hyphomicrobium sp.]